MDKNSFSNFPKIKLDSSFIIKEELYNDNEQLNGIVIYDKPQWVSSHDVVYWARKYYKTKKVGHAGTLDPFATGLLILLIGKSTKLSETFLNSNKTYKATILFGVSTTTGDIEGKINSYVNKYQSIKKDDVLNALNTLSPSYEQFVPVYSSVKVNGDKLRNLAREHEKYEITVEDNKKYVHFIKENIVKKTIPLPSKIIHILKFSVSEIKKIKIYQDNEITTEISYKDDIIKMKNLNEINELDAMEIEVTCSKGSYIRQLAMDIGDFIKKPSMLIELRRTRSGDYNL